MVGRNDGKKTHADFFTPSGREGGDDSNESISPQTFVDFESETRGFKLTLERLTSRTFPISRNRTMEELSREGSSSTRRL